MPNAFVIDRFVDAACASVSIQDRCFLFGDGVFDTLRIVGGQLYNVQAHLERLERGLAFTAMAYDVGSLVEPARQLIAKNKVDTGSLRVHISRGEQAGVGYAPGDAAPYAVMQTISRPLTYKPTAIKLYVSDIPAYYALPCKVASALQYVLSTQQAKANRADTALLLNTDGYVCETANGNIFWVRDDVLYTPAQDLPLIPGTIRAKIRSLWSGEVREGHYTIEELHDADEVFMTNATFLIAPVTTLIHASVKKNFLCTSAAQILWQALQDDIASLFPAL